jgi:hypothetical protein
LVKISYQFPTVSFSQQSCLDCLAVGLSMLRSLFGKQEYHCGIASKLVIPQSCTRASSVNYWIEAG